MRFWLRKEGGSYHHGQRNSVAGDPEICQRTEPRKEEATVLGQLLEKVIEFLSVPGFFSIKVTPNLSITEDTIVRRISWY
jgi:hypothetical protein